MTTVSSSTPWLRIYPAQTPDPALRVFCFPYAGAGASTFRDWRFAPGSGLQVGAMQPPGRENRMGEPALRRIEPLVQRYAEGLRPYLDRPFAFFGHSLGALAAFELTRFLRRTGGPVPVHLFLSAHRAPELAPKREPVTGLNAEEFLVRLTAMAGGSASAVLDRELLLALAPMMMADFELCETYVYREEAPLEVPVTCYAGDRDYEVDPPDVAAWQRHTIGEFRFLEFPGGHLFLRDHAPAILRDMADDLGASVSW